MSITGSYINKAEGIEIIIEKANVSNGQGTGTIVFFNMNYKLQFDLHYHFENNSGPQTTFLIQGFRDNPNFYVGAAGFAKDMSYNVIHLAGGVATSKEVTGFSGDFIKTSK